MFVHSRHELENTDLGKRPGPMERKITDIAPLFENWEPEVQALIAVRATSLFRYFGPRMANV